jgi:hypothetical protein
MTIWNLNRYAPLYVVRDARERDSERAGYVETVRPLAAKESSHHGQAY